MVSERKANEEYTSLAWRVLILVLVEDGLRVKKVKSIEVRYSEVLILVLVEDGLRGSSRVKKVTPLTQVLILVLVEDGLRGMVYSMTILSFWS